MWGEEEEEEEDCCPVIKRWAKPTWGQEGSLRLKHYSTLLREVGEGTQGRNMGAGVEAKPWRNAAYWLSFRFCSAFTSYHQGPPARGTTTTLTWAYNNQSAIKKTLHGLAYRPIWWKRFANWGSFLPDDTGLYKLTKDWAAEKAWIWLVYAVCMYWNFLTAFLTL